MHRIVESRKEIAPSRSHRTRRAPLDSSGSYRPTTVFNDPCANSPGWRDLTPFNQAQARIIATQHPITPHLLPHRFGCLVADGRYESNEPLTHPICHPTRPEGIAQ